uniref:G-protein coupled receptors family 1 profile domain-containing protein n=1 Tax=Meloidogyne incognita TaxID=6306 RepID=A0A914LKJ9_MELIC
MFEIIKFARIRTSMYQGSCRPDSRNREFCFFRQDPCFVHSGKYTTFKCKTPVLIAINSFLEVIHQTGHFVFLYVTATGRNFIQSSLAFKIEAHSITIAHCVSFMFMTLSIDRVLAVAFPVL